MFHKFYFSNANKSTVSYMCSYYWNSYFGNDKCSNEGNLYESGPIFTRSKTTRNGKTAERKDDSFCKSIFSEVKVFTVSLSHCNIKYPFQVRVELKIC